MDCKIESKCIFQEEKNHELSKKMNYLTTTYHPNPYYLQLLKAPPWTSFRTVLNGSQESGFIILVFPEDSE